MMRAILIGVLGTFLLHSAPTSAGTLTRDDAGRFIRELLVDGGKIEDFVDTDDARTAHRLGIRYEGARHKFLISYDIDEPVKRDIGRRGLRYDIDVEPLDQDYSRLLFSVPEIGYRNEFYFRGSKLVSRISYLARGWRRWESTHFVFCVSDTTRFNRYCADNLERFFDDAAGALRFSEEERELIEREKIYYFLCRDQEEIKLLTGFFARGMYVVAYDFIVTTFSAHYHELMHLLMNYELKDVPLYTHPFLQEGFAVAFGGRGGKEPEVILRLGSFLYGSEVVDYTDLLTSEDFGAVDASISYPASGLYNLFLVNVLGTDRYLDLYRTYSGTAAEVDRMRIPEGTLPDRSRWLDFLAAFAGSRPIEFSEPPDGACAIHIENWIEVREDEDRYYFGLQDTVLIGGRNGQRYFRSRLFDEIVGDGRYGGEKYLMTCSENEISIYNLYTGNLVANHAAAFSDPFTPVPSVDGWYRFSVRRGVFDDSLTVQTSFVER